MFGFVLFISVSIISVGQYAYYYLDWCLQTSMYISMVVKLVKYFIGGHEPNMMRLVVST